MADDDLYRILGIDANTVDVFALTERDIARHYRKQALRWHPDKNPNDEMAAAMLARVFLAYEALSDREKRSAYDDTLRAKAQRRTELALLDGDRRRMRLDLEERERAAAVTSAGSMSADVENRLRKEIERLRTEYGLRGDLSRAGKEQGVTPRKEQADDDLESSPWAAVAGFSQWYKAEIDFDDLEKAVLARARLSAREATPEGDDVDACGGKGVV
jgi:DnaJ-class molecular chaperone